MSAPTTNEARYEIVTRTGEKLKLSKEIVERQLAGNQTITESEFSMFFQLCKVYKVNPFLREAYIIKYGGQPATIVLDYKVLQQIAESNSAYTGMKHGIIVTDKNGNVIERNGEFILPNETLIAGWCEVLRNDRTVPTRVTAMFEEFKGVKKTGEANSNWTSKPCFMIVKVAKAQALREAFPNMLGSNIYISEEMDSAKNQSAPVEGKTTVTNSIIEDETIDMTASEEPVKEKEVPSNTKVDVSSLEK